MDESSRFRRSTCLQGDCRVDPGSLPANGVRVDRIAKPRRAARTPRRRRVDELGRRVHVAQRDRDEPGRDAARARGAARRRRSSVVPARDLERVRDPLLLRGLDEQVDDLRVERRAARRSPRPCRAGARPRCFGSPPGTSVAVRDVDRDRDAGSSENGRRARRRSRRSPPARPRPRRRRPARSAGLGDAPRRLERDVRAEPVVERARRRSARSAARPARPRSPPTSPTRTSRFASSRVARADVDVQVGELRAAAAPAPSAQALPRPLDDAGDDRRRASAISTRWPTQHLGATAADVANESSPLSSMCVTRRRSRRCARRARAAARRPSRARARTTCRACRRHLGERRRRLAPDARRRLLVPGRAGRGEQRAEERRQRHGASLPLTLRGTVPTLRPMTPTPAPGGPGARAGREPALTLRQPEHSSRLSAPGGSFFVPVIVQTVIATDLLTPLGAYLRLRANGTRALPARVRRAGPARPLLARRLRLAARRPRGGGGASASRSSATSPTTTSRSSSRRCRCRTTGRDLPESRFVVADVLVRFDHVSGHRRGALRRPRRGRAAARRARSAPLPDGDGARRGTLRRLPSRHEYERGVARAKEHIRRRRRVPDRALAARRARRRPRARSQLYRSLRRVNPSPYLFLLELDGGSRWSARRPRRSSRPRDARERQPDRRHDAPRRGRRRAAAPLARRTAPST